MTCVGYRLHLLELEFTDCRTVYVCERRVDYQSALYLKVIRILHFSLKPCRKTQGGGVGVTG